MKSSTPALRTRRVLHCILMLCLLLPALHVVRTRAAHAAGTIRYAKQGGQTSGACDTWNNACELRFVLASIAAAGEQIWVAGGTYTPTDGADRAVSFTLKNGVAIYGGFAGMPGTEGNFTRDWEANPTILSGDIGDPYPDAADNSYHVVFASGAGSTAVLDGFTIQAGSATGSYPWPSGEDRGGGMLNLGASPTLTNVTFSDNTAQYGAGMYNASSSPTLTNVTFSHNTASSDGGGMHNNSSSNPTLTNVTFSDNTAYSGSGIYNVGSSPTLTNVTFSHNAASSDGGGMHNDLGSNPTLTNVTFSGNSAATWSGGGMWNSGSSPTLTNVTFSGNSAPTGSGGAIMNWQESRPVIENSIFWGNGDTEFANNASAALINNSIVAGGCPYGSACRNVIDANPLLGPLADNGGFTQTMALGVGSPAIDAGNNATCASTDQRGVARPQGSACDMGAFEVVVPWVKSILRAGTDPTSAASVSFTVTFSKPMKRVSAGSFSLTVGGISGASISGVSGSGSVYTVVVNTGTGDGMLRLDVPVGSAMTDLAGNPLSNLPFTSGQTYTIMKSSAVLSVPSQGLYDGWIRESGEFTNVGGALNATNIGFSLGDDALRNQYRAILSFKTGGLPDNAVITDVKLMLVRKSENPVGSDPFYLLGGLMIDVRKGFYGAVPALELRDFAAAPVRTTVGPFKPAPMAWDRYTIALPSTAYASINKLNTNGEVTQLRLRFRVGDNNDSRANLISFYSGNAATAYRPVLVITYRAP